MLSTLRIRTAAPTPTNPPATAPASPTTSSLSFARIRTLSPATIVPLIAANVPSGTGVAGVIAPLATGSRRGAFAAIAAEDEVVCALTRELTLLSLWYASS